MKDRWEDNSPWMQMMILAFHQRAIFEEVQANTPSKSTPPPKQSAGGGKRRGRR